MVILLLFVLFVCYILFLRLYLVEAKSENFEIFTGSLCMYDHEGGKGRNPEYIACVGNT